MSTAAMTMPTAAPAALRPLLATAALLLAMAAVAQGTGAGRDPEILSKEDYPVLEETVVRGQKPPQWRAKEQAPDFNREKLKFDPQVEEPRLQAMPKYDRDERDDYMQVRDRMNAEPRIKLFEFRF